MLATKKYTGVYIYSPKMEGIRADRRGKPNAIRIEGALPAIITKEQFEEVQRIMNERKHVGAKGGQLCSGLVYCTCGAKMHSMITHRKGHEYRYYTCSQKCGVGTVKMDEVDHVAIKYLRELLSDENQEKITLSLRKYRDTQEDRDAEFKATSQ